MSMSIDIHRGPRELPLSLANRTADLTWRDEMEIFCPTVTPDSAGNCTVNVRKAAERWRTIEALNDTVENVHPALAGLDTKLFADGIGPAIIANISDDRLREWMHCVRRT
jgi:hypothetical protein